MDKQNKEIDKELMRQVLERMIVEELKEMFEYKWHHSFNIETELEINAWETTINDVVINGSDLLWECKKAFEKFEEDKDFGKLIDVIMSVEKFIEEDNHSVEIDVNGYQMSVIVLGEQGLFKRIGALMVKHYIDEWVKHYGKGE